MTYSDTDSHDRPSLTCAMHDHAMPLDRLKAWLVRERLAIFSQRVHIHRVTKKESYLMFNNNIGKCGPIFKFFSPTDL